LSECAGIDAMRGSSIEQQTRSANSRIKVHIVQRLALLSSYANHASFLPHVNTIDNGQELTTSSRLFSLPKPEVI